MTGFQKAIKIFAIGLAVFIIVQIISALLFGLGILFQFDSWTNGKRETINFLEKYQDVDRIDIDLSRSNLILQSGDTFQVEAVGNSKHFSSKVKNGTLKVEEKFGWFGYFGSSIEIVITVPKNHTLKELSIDSGAGRIEIRDIESSIFDIDQGAGVVTISNSIFQKADIDGGAGKMDLLDSTFNNLKLDAGVGQVVIQSTVTGISKLECGVGEMDITLLGNKDDYRILVEKGLGNVKIDGVSYSNDTIYGSGSNTIELEGGVGNINVQFLNR